MRKGVIMEMKNLGWELVSEDQPGLYVRGEDLVEREKEKIDWLAEPTELRDRYQEFVACLKEKGDESEIE